MPVKEYYQKTGEFDVIRFNNGRATFYAAKEQKMKKFSSLFYMPETEAPFVELNIEVDYYFLTDQLTLKTLSQMIMIIYFGLIIMEMLQK